MQTRTEMMKLLMVGCGGAVGALSRYALTGLVHRRFPLFLPLGTLVVNVAGCLVIGSLMALVATKESLPENVKLLLITGFLGSFTTFSTFGYETVELIAESNLRLALWNMAANVCVGCGAVFAGHWVTRALL